MKNPTPLLLIALALATPLLAQPANKTAQPPLRRAAAAAAVQPTGVAGNAALAYYGVWASLGEADMKLINEKYPESDFGRPLPEELHRIVTNRQSEIKRLIRASAVKNCDFGLEYGEGFNMLLPHLSKMRTTARFLAADARRCIVEGKLDDAADRYAAIFGLARHVGHDKVMISSLVSIAVASLPAGDIVDEKGAAMFTSAGRARILEAIDRLGGAEGFGLKDAIDGERAMAIDSAIDRYDGPNAGRHMEEEVLHLVDLSENGNPTPEQRASGEKIRAMNGEALHAELLKLTPFYNAAVKAWDSPDVKSRLENLSEAAARGEYGEFGYHFLPALTKCRRSQDKGKEAIDNMVAALKKADADAAADAKNPK